MTAVAHKSTAYYVTRGFIRFFVKVALLLVASMILQVVTMNIWNAMMFVSVVSCGFLIHDHKTQNTLQER